MKVLELKQVLFSTIGNIQTVKLWSRLDCEYTDSGSAEYIAKNYSDLEIERISAEDNCIVLIY